MFTIKLRETMSGWLELNADRKNEAFEFSIDVYFAQRLLWWKPQPFSGILRLRDRGYQTEIHGYLTLKVTGPRYEFKFRHPDAGLVDVKGEKCYDLANLRESLTICPLTLYQQDEAMGYAEVSYRDSILAFPFRALRLVRQGAQLGLQ